MDAFSLSSKLISHQKSFYSCKLSDQSSPIQRPSLSHTHIQAQRLLNCIPPVTILLLTIMSYLRHSFSIFFASVFVATMAYIIIENTVRFIFYWIHRFRGAHNPSATGDAGYDRNVTLVVEHNSQCRDKLQEIPVLIYGELPASLPSCSTGSEICPVCLADYMTGEEVRLLPRCHHMFHRDCIDRWLITMSALCPICRDRVIEHVVDVADINSSGANRSSSQNTDGDILGYPQSLRVHVEINVMPTISSSNL